MDFHLNYETSRNQPISVKFATGEDVSVNCLLGISFIKSAKLIIDAHDNVIESKLIECEPFAIDYKLPMRSKPNLVQRKQASTEKNLTVINAIEEACAFISTYHKLPPIIEKTTAPTSRTTFHFDNKCIESKESG